MGFNNDRRGFGCASSAKTYTVEDYPLTLPDIKKLKTLSILGNSSQDGTPSPDNPLDVVGTGVRTGNLFNAVGVANNSEDTDLKIEEYQGRQCLTWIDDKTANNQRNMQGEFKEKTQYTFCFNVYSAKTATIFIHYTDGSFTNFSIPCNGAWVTAIKQSTETKTIDYWSGNFNYATKVAIDIDSSMIVEGTYTAETLPPYEPYGYKVAVTASGRNLIDYTKAEPRTSGQTVDIIDNGVKWSGDYYFKIPVADIKAGASYTLSCKSEKVDTWNVEYIDHSLERYNININRSKRMEKDVLYIYIYKNNPNASESDMIIIDIGLYEGAYIAGTLPTYEPYKPPQSFNVYSPEVLHGVGNAHDTVILDFDKRKAELVQEVNAIKLTGSEAKLVYTNANVPILNGYYIANILPQRQNKAKYISTVFNPEIEKTNSLWVGYSNNKHIYCIVSQFYNDESEDKGLSNFNAFLKQQYDSGNPATIYYDNSRYEPTTTDITSLQDWDALPRLKGTWILSATGGTEPTLKAAYTSNTNPYPDYSNIVSVLPIYPDLDITGDDPTSERGGMEETEDQQETTSTDEPTSETNNSIDILDLYE